MTPQDVLRVAETLTSEATARCDEGQDGEAELRSAVSRAYYAAFRCAVAFVQSLGEPISDSKTVHKDTSNLLQYCGGELKKMGSLLVRLCDDRNAADYGLSVQSRREDWRKKGVSCLEDAKKIITTLEQARTSDEALNAARDSIKQKRLAISAAAKPPSR